MTWTELEPAVERATGERVVDHRPLDSVASEVYAVTLAETGRVVVKVSRIEDGPLSAPRLLDLVRRGTDVPLPGVLAVQEERSPSFVVTNYVEGRGVTDTAELSPAETRRYALEFGEVLGELHELALPVETFGRLRADDAGELHTIESFGRWRPRLRDTMAVNVDALRELALGDLAPAVGDHLDDALEAVPDVTEPALNYHDPKVDNVVLASEPGDRLLAAVLDWEGLETTHWAYPLAFFEVAFAEPQSTVPSQEVMAALRDGYATARRWDGVPLEDAWFDTYRLAARVLRAASPYWLETREDWTGAEAAELRSSIEEFL
jgi:aminoglycoside phosphotransferase (APT) family kinase protein